MARILNEASTELWRVKVTRELGRYAYNYETSRTEWKPLHEEPTYSTTYLGAYESKFVAGSASSNFGNSMYGRTIERRYQKLTAVGTITTVMDENGNETKTLGARLEWVDA